MLYTLFESIFLQKETSMNLFNIVGEDFFRPLASQNKEIYLDCLNIIYSCCGQKTSNSEERSIIQDCLIEYFSERNQDIQFEDSDSVAFRDPKSKATEVLRKLRQFGWIYEDMAKNYIVKIALNDYSATILECFRAIQKNEETEYQNVIQTIYSIVINGDALRLKPYENVIIGVQENVERLTKELKKLSTNIKRYIDKSTSGKDAAAIFDDYFTYHREIGSKAYHRLKTSNNISRFRPFIISTLKSILDDEEIFQKAVSGYMEIKDEKDREQAEGQIKQIIHKIEQDLRAYDSIIEEIEDKNYRYTSSAVERAKFLLSTDKNVEGKINKILSRLADELNSGDVSIFDDDPYLSEVFSVFPISFIDGESFYTMPESKNNGDISELSSTSLDVEKLEQAHLQMAKRLEAIITLKSIDKYVMACLGEEPKVLASTIPISNTQDFIKMIFVSFYGTKSAKYKVVKMGTIVNQNGFRYIDFQIVRR